MTGMLEDRKYVGIMSVPKDATLGELKLQIVTSGMLPHIPATTAKDEADRVEHQEDTSARSL